jgi:LysM repeat protein
MQRNYKFILFLVLVLISGVFAFGQDKTEYKDVILDGKPAKLNIATGEITFIEQKDKKQGVSLNHNGALPVKTSKTSAKSESDYYIVKEGETLFEIATHFNTSLSELKRINNLETTLIDAGQRLRVKNFEDIETTTVKSSAESQISDIKNDFHIVEKGQTLYSLSKRYGLTVNDLKQKNGLTSNIIKIGQKLNVGNFNSSEEASDLNIWTVSKGDTLYAIAKENGITVQRLKDLNGLTSNLIKVGQKLSLK